jgi:hypothetical protein
VVATAPMAPAPRQTAIEIKSAMIDLTMLTSVVPSFPAGYSCSTSPSLITVT